MKHFNMSNTQESLFDSSVTPIFLDNTLVPTSESISKLKIKRLTQFAEVQNRIGDEVYIFICFLYIKYVLFFSTSITIYVIYVISPY